MQVHLHLHLVIWQTLLSKATYNWGIHQRFILKRQSDRGSAPNTKSQSCSNKYKLVREGEEDKRESFFFFLVLG